jgi:hypothetical protein
MSGRRRSKSAGNTRIRGLDADNSFLPLRISILILLTLDSP